MAHSSGLHARDAKEEIAKVVESHPASIAQSADLYPPDAKEQSADALAAVQITPTTTVGTELNPTQQSDQGVQKNLLTGAGTRGDDSKLLTIATTDGMAPSASPIEDIVV